MLFAAAPGPASAPRARRRRIGAERGPLARALRAEGSGSPAFEGAAGRVAFDQNGDPVNKRFTMEVTRGVGAVPPEAGR